MSRRREYDQSCSLACALDRIGERWSLLIVRELCLGPLRFSDLARNVGNAPTDVLTKRLRDLESHDIVRRRALDPPATGVAYEPVAFDLGGARYLRDGAVLPADDLAAIVADSGAGVVVVEHGHISLGQVAMVGSHLVCLRT